MKDDLNDKLIEFDEFLKTEIDAFRGSQKKACTMGLTKWETHCGGVADAYQVARAWLHCNILPDRTEQGDVLITWIIKRLQSRDSLIERN